MAVFTTKNIDVLIAQMRNMPRIADKAAANTINRSATFAIKETIKLMTRENNLSESYLKSKMSVVARASRTNLRAIVKAEDRRTLLSRYPFSQTSDGVRVSIKRGSSTLIKKAKVINLRSGNGKGIALTNRDYSRYLKTSTPQLSQRSAEKLTSAFNKSINKPRGWHVLHGASVNQMFIKKREEIQPQLSRFMTEVFFDNFQRLS